MAYGLGVVRLSGLKLCPVSIPDVLVDAFHRGRLDSVEFGRGIRFPVGVVERSLDGVLRVDRREPRGLLDPWPEGVGRDEFLRPGGLDWLPILEDLCALAAGVDLVRPKVDIITEDGGELPGVSLPLPIVDLSIDSILETESRSCCPFWSP